MMNYIWPIMIIFSFFAAIATKNTGEISSTMLSSGNDAITLAIKLTGVICLWNGLIRIAEKSGLTKALCKLLSPVLKIIFPKLKDEKAKELISMNITANLLGLDNAATPLGLEAMSRLQSISCNKQTATDDMVKFVVINTACLHIIPTTVALLRQQYNSRDPIEILAPALLTSTCALLWGLTSTIILKRFFK